MKFTRARIVAILLVLAATGMGWWAKQTYWLWGYELPSKPPMGMMMSQTNLGTGLPGQLHLCQRRLTFLGGPETLLALMDQRGEVCRLSPEDGGTFRGLPAPFIRGFNVSPESEVRHWRAGVSQSVRDAFEGKGP